MQGNGGGRDPFFDFGSPFGGFGSLGGFDSHRSLLSNFFGGRDPFDGPFFTRPFGGMFESNVFGPPPSPLTFGDPHASGFLGHQIPQTHNSRGPIIEELNSDDEREEVGKNENKVNPRKHGRSSKEPFVEDPDDVTEGRRSKQIQYMNDFNTVNNAGSQPHTQSFTFQSSTVTYGGSNGAYYTSSRTRRTGGDGLMIEESKEADTATRQATHKLSRGIHNKGHSVARKLNPDGRVDTMQMLHNLNEDELGSFEDAWKDNARKHLPGWSDGFNMNGSGSNGSNRLMSRGGWALPSTQPTQHSQDMKPEVEERASSSRPHHSGRMKANMGERTGSFSARPRTANGGNKDQFRRQ